MERKSFCGDLQVSVIAEYQAIPLNVSTNLNCMVHSETRLLNMKTNSPATSSDFQHLRSHRPPVITTFVLDTSGSMGGLPLTLVKKSLKKVIELATGDVVGIVTFNSHIDTITPLVLLSEDVKGKLLPQIDKMQAQNCTDLFSGLKKGLEILWDASYPLTCENERRNLIILTDGIANEGIIKETEIVKELQTIPNSDRTNIYTMGLGNNVNADLLQTLAINYHGKLYAIPDEKMIQIAFGDCLGSLLSNIGTECVISVSSKFKVEDCSGINYEQPDPNTLRYTFGTVFLDEEKDILFSVKLPPQSDEQDLVVADVFITYFDTYAKTKRSTHSSVHIDVKGNQRSDTMLPNPQVYQQSIRVKVASLCDVLSNCISFDHENRVLQELRAIKKQIEDEKWCNTPLGQMLVSQITDMTSLSREYGVLAYRQISTNLKYQRTGPTQPSVSNSDDDIYGNVPYVNALQRSVTQQF